MLNIGFGNDMVPIVWSNAYLQQMEYRWLRARKM